MPPEIETLCSVPLTVRAAVPPVAGRFVKSSRSCAVSEDTRVELPSVASWKLEEMELERRRSMEAGVSKHDLSGDNNNQTKQEPLEAAKPPQGDASSRKERRKKSSREEKSESSLLRRPSMKKIKAYFDKDKNKENKDEGRETDPGEDSLAGSVAHKCAAHTPVGGVCAAHLRASVKARLATEHAPKSHPYHTRRRDDSVIEFCLRLSPSKLGFKYCLQRETRIDSPLPCPLLIFANSEKKSCQMTRTFKAF